MSRLPQTLGRVGFGFSTLASLTWLLWPNDLADFLEPEPLFAFATALVVWVLAEFKMSEEVLYRDSSPNDIRLAKKILAYRASTLALILRDHDFHSSIDERYLREIDALVVDWANGTAKFQNSRVQKAFDGFCEALKDFNIYLSLHSSPLSGSEGRRQSVIPMKHYGDFDLPQPYCGEVLETNRLATIAWNKLERVYMVIDKEIPEARDEPLQSGWIRAKSYDELFGRGSE